MPITDSCDEEGLGEAKVAGTVGSFALVADEQAPRLIWVDSQNPDTEVVFERVEAE